MPRLAKFAPAKSGNRWTVSIPAAMSETGSRQRKSFPSESAAKLFAGKLRASLAGGNSVISSELANEARSALRILAPLGIGLIEAAREIAQIRNRSIDPETFRERLTRAQVANEGRWRPRYADDIAKLAKWLPASTLDAKCADLDAIAIRDGLREMGAVATSTLDNRARYAAAILNHRERHHKSTEIVILTFAQAIKVLGACRDNDERMAVSLLLFAGIRPDGELSRLDWSDVLGTSIYISPEVSKTGSDRIVPVTVRLARLIDDHPQTGPVQPASWKRSIQRIRRECGITAQDVFRHTFASNFLAAFGEESAKNAMGHTEGSQTLFRHYRRAVTKPEGELYFA